MEQIFLTLSHLVRLDSVLPSTSAASGLNVTTPTATIPTVTNTRGMAAQGQGMFPNTSSITEGPVALFAPYLDIETDLYWNSATKEIIIVVFEYGSLIDERLTMLTRQNFPLTTILNGAGLNIESWAWYDPNNNGSYDGVARWVAYHTGHHFDPNNIQQGQVFNERVQAQVAYKYTFRRGYSATNSSQPYVDFNVLLY